MQSSESSKIIDEEKYNDKTFAMNANAISQMMDVLEKSETSSTRSDSFEITLNESQISDKRTIKLVHEGVRGLISIIKDKYVQLRQQRKEILKLRERVKLTEAQAQQFEEVKSELERNRQEKSSLEMKLRELSLSSESTTELKERIERLEGERRIQDTIISRNLNLKEKEIYDLNADRDQLLQKLNNVMSSLNICKEEFDKIHSALKM